MNPALKQIQADIARIKGLMAQLNTELAALEHAERLLRPYYGAQQSLIGDGDISRLSSFTFESDPVDRVEERGNYGFPELGTTPEDTPGDLFGKRIREAAVIILAEAAGGSLHYREVAERAMARGYRSYNSENDPEKVANSFRAIMKRNDEFKHTGPEFWLK